MVFLFTLLFAVGVSFAADNTDRTGIGDSGTPDLEKVNTTNPQEEIPDSSINAIEDDNINTQTNQSEQAAAGVQTDAAAGTGTATIKEVAQAGTNVKNSFETSGVSPSTVNVAGTTVSRPTYIRMEASAVVQLNYKTNVPIEMRAVSNPVKPASTLKAGTLTKAQYVDIAVRMRNYINKNSRLPNYVTTPLGKMSYDQFMYNYAKVLNFYNAKGRLPTSLSVVTKVSPKPVVYTIPDEYKTYLEATKNCQVTDAQIQALAKKLSGGSNGIQAATNIFNWVRDNLSYQYYYNTKKGAVTTLKERSGNCCDHTHLLIALLRAAGIPAKYVHVTAAFSSGTYGHVYAQAYVQGVWYSVDATSSRNTFGVINSWTLISYKGLYRELPF